MSLNFGTGKISPLSTSASFGTTPCRAGCARRRSALMLTHGD
jgi:hypothetical protein